MSAIGAVDWYDVANNSTSDGAQGARSNPETTSLYPAEFLQEVADKVGPRFYSMIFSEKNLMRVLSGTLSLNPCIAYQQPATMLPISSTKFPQLPTTRAGTVSLLDAHPAVSTWRINPDLSVAIHRACIISFTGQARSPDRKIFADISGPGLQSVFSVEGDLKRMDVDHWVEGFFPPTRNSAVCLEYGEQMTGILLKEIVMGDLVKVGYFRIMHPPEFLLPPPRTNEVHWRVL
ncbi:hypothetical protein BDW74DRAFT_142934 [Aspergillus multicolor]|uniref:uncharacterized protein n=1 Tax=Aspergillus multicolor TaxID=41759 RepID=UPI003CCD22F9